MPATGGAFEKVGVQAVVEGFGRYMQNLGKMEAKSKGFGSALGKLGKTALAMGAGFVAAQASMAGVRAIMSKSIGAAVAYEAQMAEIRALTGATEKDTDFLTVAIKDMTRAMPKSPEELGAAAYFILSSGIEDAADAAEVLEVAAKASTIGLGETASVADALTTVLNAYGKSADEAGQVTDVMIEAVKQGKAEADAFAGVLGRVVPLAAQMGISFEEVSANLATFTRLGVSADLAATGLRQVMASLLKPTEDQEEAMEELGFSAEGLRQQIKDKGLLVTLDAMMKATGGNEAAVARLFPNIRALTSVLGTVGVQMDAYTDILAATENASGNLEEGFGIVADTAKFKMGVAMNELNLILMDLGTMTLPLIVRAAQELSAELGDIQAILGSLQGDVDDTNRVLDKQSDSWTDWISVTGSAQASGVVLGRALGGLVTDTSELSGATDDQIGILKKEAEALAETGKTTRDIAEETSEFDTQVAALATRLGLSEQALRDSGLSIDELRDETKELNAEVARSPAAWQAFDKELAASAMLQAELEGALADTGAQAMGMSGAIDSLTASLKGAASANEELMSILSGITSQRTQETTALDIQINALELEQNAALQAEVGQESLGDAVASTTDALTRQIGALNNLAASMVPQALNNEIIALGRELKVLELGKAAIEAQINARNRLAQAQLAMARIANLPAMLELKKLELKREELLAAQSAKTLRLEKEKAKLLAKADPSDADKERIKVIDALLAVQKAAIKQIDDEMEALSRGIHIKTLEAEITNLQAEASDKNREAMQKELNKITDQIGATTDLKQQRELYIETLVPVELLQDIDALGRQKTALDNSKTAAEGAKGATKNLSDTIGDQIAKLDLEREAIDLVTKGWELQALAMMNLPTLADIATELGQFKTLLILQVRMALVEAIGAGDWIKARALAALFADIIPPIADISVPFHEGGIIPAGVTVPAMLHGPEAVIPLSQSQPILAPSVAPQAVAAAGGGVDPTALGAAVAFALQGMTVEMDGRIVGSLVNDRIGDRTSLLGRGG